MAGQIKHIFTNPQADVTNTNIVRPSDWNSVHAYTLPDGISAGTQLMSSGTVVFANSNGISFGMSGSSQITAAHNGLTTAAASDHSHGNPTLALTNLSGTTASASNGFTLSLSAGVGGAGDGGNVLAAGTQTANTTGTVLFDNANGISFGMANSSVVTASYTVPSVAGLLSNINVSAGTTSQHLSAVTFSNLNGISFGLNGSVITGAHDGLTSQSNQAFSANGGSSLFQTLSLADLNGFTFSNIGGSVVGSYTVPVSGNAIQFVGSAAANGTNTSRFAMDDHVHAGVQSLGVSTGGNTVGNTRVDVGYVVLQGGNNVTLSQITGANGANTVVISGGAAGGADGVNALVVNAGASTASTTLTLSNGNNVTFGLAAGVITASASFNQTSQSAIKAFGVSNTGQTAGNTGVSSGIDWVLAGSQSITLSQSTNAGGPNTVWFQHPAWLTTAAQSNHSHGNPTLALTNLTGTTASASNGFTLSLSAAAPGAAAENNWVNLLGANTAGNTTASGSTMGYSGINLTLSGTNGSVVNISAPATSSLVGTSGISISTNGSTISVIGPAITQRWQWPPGNLTAVAALGNGSFSINRIQPQAQVSATRLDAPFLVSLASSATANTWGLAVTVFGAVYTKNGNTLSSLSSGSTSWSTSLASNSAGGTQIIAHAIRPLSIPMNVNMSAGEYYVGFGVSTNTSSAGTATTALGNTWSIMGGPIYSSAVGQVGDFTATTNTSTGLMGGQGIYSAAISTVPPTVSLSAINQTGSYYARANVGLIFRNI